MSTPESRNDAIEHGDLAALVCIDDPILQAVIIEQLTQLGFGVHTALFAEEASVKLTSRSYDVVVVDENFAGSDVETNPALTEIANIPLSQRRSTYAILIGPGMVSRSEMQAFKHSVDLVLKEDEAPNLKTIAGRGIVRQEEFYATFTNVLRAIRAL